MVYSSNLTTVLAQKLHPVIEIKHSKVYNNNNKNASIYPELKWKQIKQRR